ncbi:MAG: hypothetical protein JJU02_04610 [Cryomorphaceae bacterium]|nr:hypothetical protein [Cryomorphaceae bacterium]
MQEVNHMILKKSMLYLLVGFLFFSCGNTGDSCFDQTCIYLQGTEHTYQGIFVDQDSDTTFYEIQLISGGGHFLLQKKLKYIVERVPNTKHPEKFLSESTTGFTETVEGIWLHPPRVDKFRYITQLAPYPEVKFPLTLNDTIAGSIHMMGNWGDWTGHSSSFHLTVASDTVLKNAGATESAFVLKGCGTILNDISCVSYVFSPNRGFVYAKYQNSRSEFFEMRLTE